MCVGYGDIAWMIGCAGVWGYRMDDWVCVGVWGYRMDDWVCVWGMGTWGR